MDLGDGEAHIPQFLYILSKNLNRCTLASTTNTDEIRPRHTPRGSGFGFLSSPTPTGLGDIA